MGDSARCVGVSSYQIKSYLAPLLARVRVGDARFAQAALQARHVLVKSVRLRRLAGSAVERNAFVHTVAEDEAAVKRADARFAHGHDLAIQVAGQLG